MHAPTLPVVGAGAAALAFTIALSVASPAAVSAAGPPLDGGRGPSGPAVVAPSPLTAAQAVDLRVMAEEEKVARDLYRAFAARYPSVLWDRIAAAEAAHLASVRTILARYVVTDPTAGRAEGSFASAAAQTMYARLLAAGSVSEVAAFGVGRTVELDDIAALDTALARATQADVRQVYANLRRASTQHLRAFERQLGR
jgi:hypothetical protein